MAIAGYDQIAGWYDASVRAGSLLHALAVPSLCDLAGDLHGQRVCDLACGQGIVARQLAACGATVTGVDLSDELLAIARREEAAEPRGVVYLRDDARTLASIGDATFDGVLCNLALMDIPDLPATCGTVRRVVRDGGWFVFAITHPCFEAPGSRWVADGELLYRQVRGYFVEGYWRSDNPDGVRGKVGAHHRTLSTYLNTLRLAGFDLERVAEPRATGELAGRVPGYGEAPPLLVARCRAR